MSKHFKPVDPNQFRSKMTIWNLSQAEVKVVTRWVLCTIFFIPETFLMLFEISLLQ